ncbi:hypothetical protein PVW48_06705 [Dinoroseobacter sp. PD6]|nr:hypothetical protein [Dinoroseobacter sp. PD6]MDD9716427.1 hypothetical protein [Dinoroseobacter sp. PD6]
MPDFGRAPVPLEDAGCLVSEPVDQPTPRTGGQKTIEISAKKWNDF